ncbi:MAG: aldehyde ferredoxin oxidoreductase N-terminal domain-containing protein [Desulforhopalus sp.]|jgi:aldehyde:ferredoxin oxidoreductase|nr:aldehyde ferredoxin oxidoreductase N-terminal domain-containing protein [Desulforhopalus sp.]
MRQEFRVIHVDVATGQAKIVTIDRRNEVAGGSGLAALLFAEYGQVDRPWDDPAQPLIFAIGPLTGYYPLMSKMVCAFRSTYHGQYTESHAGGRAAFALRFADFDALVITGRAAQLSCLLLGAHHVVVKEGEFLRGMDVESTGRLVRRIYKGGSGHRSIMRIGPAGENLSAMACINVDSYRHFGRLGGGASMGAKNLKAIIIQGDSHFAAPAGKSYAALCRDLYQQVTATEMMRKYYNLGTAANLASLNELQALPWRNLQQTRDETGIAGITGTAFADTTLLRNGACSGCPVGCIHIGFIRDRIAADNRYHYHQVAYDYEPIFAAGTMLGVTSAFDVLRILEVIERVGLDAMSAGVALAWATEATARGLLSTAETVVPLAFGDVAAYQEAARHLGQGSNGFYQLLGQGTLAAAGRYGGAEFACVLGQEMAGYATGELFFAAQTLGFRHSHLDTGAYSYEQQHPEKDVTGGVDFLIADEPGRVFLTSMVGCLFARSVYSRDRLAECLEALGFSGLAGDIDATAEHIRRLRWRVRAGTGFDPASLCIPKRFSQITTWKGPIDQTYLDAVKSEYGRRIQALIAKENDQPRKTG